jgi:hypothetical protein
MAGVIDLLSSADPLNLLTQVLTLIYLVYETRRGKIKQLENVVVAMVTVIRAMSRTNEEIDSAKIDKYILENGINPDHFIVTKNDSNNRPDEQRQDD